jgi:uncharacterized protein YfaT (DUF1175 family)
MALATEKELPALILDAKLSVDHDALLTPEQKESLKGWLLDIAKDQESADLERRATVASFLLTGERPR